MATYIGERFDVGAASGLSNGKVFMTLPCLTVAGGSKLRRISISKKMDFVESAASDSTVRSVGQLMAATKLIEEKKGDAPTCKGPRDGKRFVTAQLYQYNCSALDSWSDTRHVSYASDGGRVDGRDRQMTCFFSPERLCNNWAAPLATWRLLCF
jgi:hypothetical protein